MGEGSREANAGRSGHWVLLLVAPLLAYRLPVFASASFDPGYLLVPFAALLGRRLGLTGVIALAIGALPFVVGFQGRFFPGSFGGSPALYLIALCVAAMAASAKPFEWPRWPAQDRMATRVALAAPSMLVLSIAIGHSQTAASGGTRLAFYFSLSLLGYFAIFAMAARGVRLWPVLVGLVAAAAITWPLTLAGVLPGQRSDPSLAVSLVQPATALAALVFYSVGATLRASLERRAAWGFWRWPYLAAAALLVIWFGPDPSIRIEGSWVSVRFFQVAAVLPVVAFAAGLLRGVRGTAFVTVAASVLVLVGFLLHDIGAFRGRVVPLEAPFVAAAYGRLGAALTEQSAGAAAGSRVMRAISYVLLGLATTSAIAQDGGVVRTFLAAAFATAFCLLYYAGVRARRATAGTSHQITSEGWLTFTTLVCVAVILGANAQQVLNELGSQFQGLLFFVGAVYETLREGRQADMGTAAIAAVFVAVFALGAVSAIRKSVKDLRKVLGDLKTLAAYASRRAANASMEEQ